jgi:hypothetical protein
MSDQLYLDLGFKSNVDMEQHFRNQIAISDDPQAKVWLNSSLIKRVETLKKEVADLRKGLQQIVDLNELNSSIWAQEILDNLDCVNWGE